jgi:hypothetical protein
VSIVVYGLSPEGIPTCQGFESAQLTDALRATEARRKEGMRHVCISSELGDSIGKPGVNTIVDGKLPDGHVYDWSKAHRGAGPMKA